MGQTVQEGKTMRGGLAVLRRAGLVALGAVLTALVGCGGTTGSSSNSVGSGAASTPSVAANPAAESGFVSAPQVTGKIPSLPVGPLYVDIEQVPAGTVPSSSVTSDCILYPVSNAQPGTSASGGTNSSSTTAVFIGPDGASYPRTGVAVVADAFCLRPSSDRGHGPAVTGATSIYSSADFSELTAPGPYSAQLTLVNIQPHGRGAAHTHPGPETLLATQGATTYHLGGAMPEDLSGALSPITLTVGQALTHAANQPVQDFNNGDVVATTLSFRVWPAALPGRSELPTAL